MTRIVHASDLHFGPPLREDSMEAFLECVAELEPDLFVLSGDFVQRAAFVRQFLDARDFLQRLPAPYIGVPGNHEVSVLNPLDRLFQPYLYFQRYIQKELESHWEGPDVTVFGLNSSKPYLLHRGVIVGRQLESLERRLKAFGKNRQKWVVTHHPLVPLTDVFSLPQIRSRQTLRAFARLGVDLVLSGHYHTPRVVQASTFVPDLEREVHVLLCGSTTSNRANRPHQGGNSFAVIDVQGAHAAIDFHRFRDGRFVADRTPQSLQGLGSGQPAG